MRFEFSAGGIVYKKTKDQRLKTKNILVLVCQHSQHHGWVFPKGLIGDHVKGEKKEETAIREVEEETGVKAEIIKPLKPVTYWYVFSAKGRGDPSAGSLQQGSGQAGREKIKKTVYYFLMEFISQDSGKKDLEMENVEWLPVDEIEKRLTYKSDKEVWKEAKLAISR